MYSNCTSTEIIPFVLQVHLYFDGYVTDPLMNVSTVSSQPESFLNINRL